MPRAAAANLTHEIWVVYQSRLPNAPVRLLFWHQYDFGALFPEGYTPPRQYQQRQIELMKAADRAALYVTKAIAYSLATQRIMANLRRQAVSELKQIDESRESFERAREALLLEHKRLDLYWFSVANQAMGNYLHKPETVTVVAP